MYQFNFNNDNVVTMTTVNGTMDLWNNLKKGFRKCIAGTKTFMQAVTHPVNHNDGALAYVCEKVEDKTLVLDEESKAAVVVAQKNSSKKQWCQVGATIGGAVLAMLVGGVGGAVIGFTALAFGATALVSNLMGYSAAVRLHESNSVDTAEAATTA